MIFKTFIQLATWVEWTSICLTVIALKWMQILYQLMSLHSGIVFYKRWTLKKKQQHYCRLYLCATYNVFRRYMGFSICRITSFDWATSHKYHLRICATIKSCIFISTTTLNCKKRRKKPKQTKNPPRFWMCIFIYAYHDCINCMFVFNLLILKWSPISV